MGFFDKFKNILGGEDKVVKETVKGPSRVLREAGIDASSLDCDISADGTLTVSGTLSSGDERAKAIEVLNGMPNINRVVNEINVGAPAPEPVPEPAVVAEAAPATDGGRTYTVQSGDTLWKISQEMYGNGSKYMKIFEANTDLLENPDKIFPGQELKIPDLED